MSQDFFFSFCLSIGNLFPDFWFLENAFHCFLVLFRALILQIGEDLANNFGDIFLEYFLCFFIHIQQDIPDLHQILTFSFISSL